MQEFEDGILLFEISDKKVWSKSSEDSTGLKKFFEDNNDNYVWGKRAKCEVYYSGKMEIINEAMGMAKDSNLILSQIKNRLNQKSQLNLTAYSGTFELGSNKVLKNFNIKKTGVTELKMIDGELQGIFESDKLEKNKMISGDEDAKYLGDENEWLVLYCKEKLTKKHYDYFVFGHRHLPLEIKLKENSTYMNLGDWIQYFTYGEFNNSEFKLLKFNENSL